MSRMRAAPLLAGALCAVAALASAAAPPARAQGKASAAPPPGDCFQQLFHGTGSEIACKFPTRLTEKEREELKRATRDMLKDAVCTVDIRIERRLVDEAMAAGDHVFEAPPQPVLCEITAPDRVFPIKATFAPRIVFRGGTAVEGSPGLANVTGVPTPLAWPAVAYVNKSATIRTNMLQIINAVAAGVRKTRGK